MSYLIVPFQNKSHIHTFHITCSGDAGVATQMVARNAYRCLFCHRVSR